jgi:hypothetical protein
MKVRNNVWLLPIFLCTILKGGSAIRGEPLSSQAQTKSRNLKKKGSKSGLFGAVLNDVETKKERNEKKDEEYEIFAASLNVTSDIPANLTGSKSDSWYGQMKTNEYDNVLTISFFFF